MLGCGFGMMYVPAIVMPTLYFAKWRALASGIGVTGSGLGTLLVPPIITPLLKKLGWRNTFRCIIFVVLFAGLLTFAYLPLRPLIASDHQDKKNIHFDPSTRKSKVNFQDLPQNRKCCTSKNYQNQAFPTTNELINPDNAKLEIDEMTGAERRATNYFGDSDTTSVMLGRKSMGFIGMRQSRYIASIAEFTNKDLCKYNCLVCLYSECCEQDAKPMYRDDIFFSNSIKLIPKYKRTAMRMKKKIRDKKKQKDKEKDKQRLDKLMNEAINREEQQDILKKYHMSVTRVTVYKEYTDRPKCRCHLSIVRALSTLLHLELFKSITFIITGLAGLLYILGYMIPFMYVVDRAKKADIDEGITFWFLAVIGGANTLGRLMSGILPSVLPLDVIILTWVPAFICGINTVCSGLCMKPWFQFASGACFGFFGAFLPSLRPVVIVELFGLENLTNIFGLQLLMSGFAAFFGPTVAGILYDQTKTYQYSFYLSGGCIIGSGALFVFIRKIRKWELGDDYEDEFDYDSDAGPA